MTTVSTELGTLCIDCEQTIQLTFQPQVGQVITCPHCGAQMEIIDVDPIELDWVYLEPDEGAPEWDWD